MNRFFLIILFCLALTPTTPAQEILDQYVRQAIEQNEAIREKTSLEQKQQWALAHAQKMSGPEINLQTSYTLAAGGRSIDFPVGLLLNDVYSTLNTLTGTQNFKAVGDEKITFLPNNFYDTRLRITQPVIRPEIKYNKRIRAEELTLAELQTHQSIRDLIMEVKTAYLHWMQAAEVIEIIDQGLVLLGENKRITERLIQNGVAVPSALMRIESEITRTQAQKESAKANLTNAASYFNFLLHRPADAEIIRDDIEGLPVVTPAADLSSREELLQIQAALRIQNLALQLEEKQYAPTLGVQLDIGSQAFAPDWGGYVLGGLMLEIPIWDNRKSRLKQKEWMAAKEATEAKYNWTQKALETELLAKIENLRADIINYDSYTSLLSSNQRMYDETLRRYREGLAGYMELLDARTEVTQTQLEQNLAKYKTWLSYFEIERISASAPIP